MSDQKVLDDLGQLTGAGYDVVMGTRKGPDTTGVYVALEHPSLDEPQEFYAITLLDALRQACFWADLRGKP